MISISRRLGLQVWHMVSSKLFLNKLNLVRMTTRHPIIFPSAAFGDDGRGIQVPGGGAHHQRSDMATSSLSDPPTTAPNDRNIKSDMFDFFSPSQSIKPILLLSSKGSDRISKLRERALWYTKATAEYKTFTHPHCMRYEAGYVPVQYRCINSSQPRNKPRPHTHISSQSVGFFCELTNEGLEFVFRGVTEGANRRACFVWKRKERAHGFGVIWIF